MYLGLTGARLKAADALYAGVATHYIPRDKHDTLIDQLSHGDTVEQVLEALAEEAGPAPLADRQSKIDEMFCGRSVETIIETLKSSEEEWAQDLGKQLDTKSPTSLKVTYRQIREGAELGFRDCMTLEYRLTSRVMAAHDFYEGVRAVVIDKDQNPKWQPADLDGVSSGDVERYFAPLGAEELVLD